MTNNRTSQKISVSLPDDVIDELDARSGNRSGEITHSLRAYWAVLDLGLRQCEEALGSDIEDALEAVRASGVAPRSPVVCDSSAFAEIVHLGCGLIRLSADDAIRIREAAETLDMVGRLALLEACAESYPGEVD